MAAGMKGFVLLYQEYESRIDTGHADYFLSDSIDVNDGSLGQKFLIEVAPEFYGKFNKFKLRMRERNGERILMTVWTLDELRAVTQPMWPDSEVEFLFRVREVLLAMNKLWRWMITLTTLPSGSLD